jgi:Uma2 family endonuclease
MMDAAMARPAPKLDERMTLAEYLRRGETSEIKHEFHDGEVLAMSGGTYNHARVATNLVIALGPRLRGSPCEVLDSNMRVATQATRRFVYPEATIVCGGPVFHPEDPKRTTIINPRVIFEVLSESTEAYDRGEKFAHYQRMESLEEYLLISQDRALVEGFLRQADGSWNLLSWRGLDAVARVRCLEIQLPLSELYSGLPDMGATSI